MIEDGSVLDSDMFDGLDRKGRTVGCRYLEGYHWAMTGIKLGRIWEIVMHVITPNIVMQ